MMKKQRRRLSGEFDTVEARGESVVASEEEATREVEEEWRKFERNNPIVRRRSDNYSC